VLLTAATMVLGLAAPVSAASPRVQKPTADRGHMSDNLPGPLTKQQDALKVKARDMVAKGKATPKGKNQAVEVGKGQFVELAFEGDDQIFTLLGEFGNEVATHDHGPITAGGFGVINHGGTNGPVHNAIPQPTRATDNTTIWTADFNQSHYENLLFNKTQNPSMANWYLEQSSGRFSVDGYVSDWVHVPFNEAAYGSNYCGSIVCSRDIGRFLVDQTRAWYQAQLDSGKSAAQIDAMLAPFDVWDRNDYDHDGNFDEPDGYIDHFQSVHAGEGEETGGGAQATNAIWSHRSFANAGFPTSAGPSVDGNLDAQGGLPLGGSKFWIGDYTIEPENGGVGVFSHEFGHDLGLPDEYDTSGNTGGAENSTAWWTPWSQGSYGTVTDDLGSAPVDATVWEKWMLGWANVGVAHAGQSSSHRLSASEISTKQKQGLEVVLPDKVLSEQIGDPHSGSYLYDSNHGNNLDNTMTRTITLPAGTVNVSFWANYDIETCWDYADLQVSTDGGANFANIHTSASSGENTNGQNFGEGITGRSGAPFVCDSVGGARTWAQITANLDAYAGQTIQLRFRYWTDGAAVGKGFQVDDLEITGQPADGGETDVGWTFDGFRRTQAVLVTAAVAVTVRVNIGRRAGGEHPVTVVVREPAAGALAFQLGLHAVVAGVGIHGDLPRQVTVVQLVIHGRLGDRRRRDRRADREHGRGGHGRQDGPSHMMLASPMGIGETGPGRVLASSPPGAGRLRGAAPFRRLAVEGARGGTGGSRGHGCRGGRRRGRVCGAALAGRGGLADREVRRQLAL
jgi:immune inhibitor A